MDVLRFKTNMGSRNCVQKASQELDKIGAIKNWEVETTRQDHILTVRGSTLEAAKIIHATRRAGFQARLI